MLFCGLVHNAHSKMIIEKELQCNVEGLGVCGKKHV